MKILIASDKFKGSLSAAEVAEAISRGIREVWADARIAHKPIADGGEGFAEALATSTMEAQTVDALGRPVTATYGWVDATTAVIEMSAASGLWRMAAAERDPMRASTAGTGRLMRDAISRGAREILLGIGGSATNDGGIGMAGALGYQFLDADGKPLEAIPANLEGFASILAPDMATFPRVVAACDVNNPLLGERGATRVYGPQKGVTPEMIGPLERGLEHLADLVGRDLRHDYRRAPGSGAAGGLGFGLMSFCNAETRSGFDLVADCVGLEEAIAESDLVITGEGKIDGQTLHGKAPARVAELARKHGKAVIAFAGMHEVGGGIEKVFDAVFQIHRAENSVEHSIANGAALLEGLAREVAAKIRDGEVLPGLSLG